MYISTKNVLLMKDSVGKAKPTTQNLPDVSHAYGFKPANTGANLKDCLSRGEQSKAEPPFVKPNQMNPEKLDPNARAYGIKNRPSTAFNTVINFAYGNEAEKAAAETYKKFNETRNVKKLLNHKDTASNKLKQQANQAYLQRTFGKDTKEPFKMARFKSVEPKVIRATKENVQQV